MEGSGPSELGSPVLLGKGTGRAVALWQDGHGVASTGLEWCGRLGRVLAVPFRDPGPARQVVERHGAVGLSQAVGTGSVPVGPVKAWQSWLGQYGSECLGVSRLFWNGWSGNGEWWLGFVGRHGLVMAWVAREGESCPGSDVWLGYGTHSRVAAVVVSRVLASSASRVGSSHGRHALVRQVMARQCHGAAVAAGVGTDVK